MNQINTHLRHQPQPRKKSGPRGYGWLIGGLFLLYLVFYWVTDSLNLGDDTSSADFTSSEVNYYSETETYTGPPIRRFTPTDAANLSRSLAPAEKQYGVCFGWKLVDGSNKKSFDQGSSRGPNVPASSCPRWVEAQVSVANAASSSDYDEADITTVGSANIRGDLPFTTEFAELGITADALVANPVATTGHATLSMPLLLTQNHVLSPRETPQAGGNPNAAPAPPLPPAQAPASTMTTAWVWLSVFGALGLLSLLLGFRAKKNQKSTPDQPFDGVSAHPATQAPPPAQPPAAPTGGFPAQPPRQQLPPRPPPQPPGSQPPSRPPGPSSAGPQHPEGPRR